MITLKKYVFFCYGILLCKAGIKPFIRDWQQSVISKKTLSAATGISPLWQTEIFLHILKNSFCKSLHG